MSSGKPDSALASASLSSTACQRSVEETANSSASTPAVARWPRFSSRMRRHAG